MCATSVAQHRQVPRETDEKIYQLLPNCFPMPPLMPAEQQSCVPSVLLPAMVAPFGYLYSFCDLFQLFFAADNKIL